MSARWVWVLALAGLLGGCDRDPYGLEGSFQGKVEGGLDFTLSGGAVWAETCCDEELDFVLEATAMSKTDVHKIGLLRSGAARPVEGEYELGTVHSGFYGFYLRTVNDTAWAFFSSVDRAGELIITGSTSREVRGSFSFVAEGFTLESGDEVVEVTVSGTFTGKPGIVFFRP